MGHALAIVHYQAALTVTTPVQLIDLSDDTNYKHSGTEHIHLFGVHLSAFITGTGNWTLNLGTILESDASNGTAEWFFGITFSQILYLNADRDYSLGGTNHAGLFLAVIDGATPRILSNASQVGHVNWDNNGGIVSTLGASSGNPAPGDIVMLATENSGTGMCSVDITLQYHAS